MLRRLGNERAALATLALTLSMCTSAGTETDNPVVDFDGTGCKSHPAAPTALTLASTVARTRPIVDVEPSAYEGLYCYAWEVHDDGRVTLDVLNYFSGCSIVWELGESKVNGDQIDLGIAMVSCQVAACGACLYDFTFELEGVDTSAPAGVQVRRLACDELPEVPGERVMLPLDQSEIGILCRPVHSFGFGDACGEAHKRTCGGDEPACNEGLVVARHEADDVDACFAPCDVDGDCPLEAESCQEGACRLREAF